MIAGPPDRRITPRLAVSLVGRIRSSPEILVVGIAGGELEEELGFLRSEIYRWEANPPIKYLTAFDRFNVGS